MKITFDHLQENKTNMAGKVAQTGMVTEKSIHSTKNVSGVLLSKGQEQQAYGKQGKSMQDIKDKAGLFSGEEYKNYMAVMSSTMSGEDFSAMMEEGIQPGKTPVGDAVTIMDHIKAVMAKSGVVVSGFNANGDIPMEKLEQMTGNPAYAQSIYDAFKENDVPVTEENVTEAIKQSDRALEITGLSEEVKQYLIENDMEISVDSVYKAKFSAQSGRDMKEGKRGQYFSDDMNGYFGKQAGEVNYDDLTFQIEKVINEAGLVSSEETKREAKWLLDRGMFFTEKNMEKLHRINEAKFPLSREEVFSRIAQALREGKQAGDADLTKDGIFKEAVRLMQQVNEISPEAVERVVTLGEAFHIRNLASAQREIQLTQATQENRAKDDRALLHAQRTLEEVRLQMTVSANVMLLRSNYSIDTTELSQLVEDLKEMEQMQNLTYGLKTEDATKQPMFYDAMEKTAAIRQMPAAVIPKVMSAADYITLQKVYEEGRVLQSSYQKAGETYEALMTAPRADLGDKISNAFSNIDDILQDLDFELTQDNRRAVRILAYNKTELTRENIIQVRATDAELQFLLNKMTPSATLQMIRDGINPLEENVQQLTEYFSAKDNELTQQTENFARFLYELDHNGGISPQERETYMGIYRLIRQIEKGDGKAIGTVINNGQELSFANLLSAVRTGQKKSINQIVDNSFGVLDGVENRGNSISDQINKYYERKASDLLDKLSPSVMAQENVTMQTTWEELVELSEMQKTPEEITSAYREEQLRVLRQDIGFMDQSVEFLLAHKQPVTPDNIHGAKEMSKRRGDMFGKIKEMKLEEMAEPGAQTEQDFSYVLEQFTDAKSAQKAYDTMQDVMETRLEQAMLTKDMQYLDIRALSSLSKQLSLAGRMAREESYELPAVIDGQLTGVSVRFRQEEEGSENKGTVSIRAELSDGEKVMAEFKLQDALIMGYMGCSSREKTRQLLEKREDFIQNILSETGKTADINFVYSEEIKTITYEYNHQAGKQMKNNVRDLAQTDKQTEEVQGRHTSAKELYLTAKVFIALLSE